MSVRNDRHKIVHVDERKQMNRRAFRYFNTGRHAGFSLRRRYPSAGRTGSPRRLQLSTAATEGR
jgi:hypothetical protein